MEKKFCFWWCDRDRVDDRRRNCPKLIVLIKNHVHAHSALASAVAMAGLGRNVGRLVDADDAGDIGMRSRWFVVFTNGINTFIHFISLNAKYVFIFLNFIFVLSQIYNFLKCVNWMKFRFDLRFLLTYKTKIVFIYAVTVLCCLFALSIGRAVWLRANRAAQSEGDLLVKLTDWGPTTNPVKIKS